MSERTTALTMAIRRAEVLDRLLTPAEIDAKWDAIGGFGGLNWLLERQDRAFVEVGSRAVEGFLPWLEAFNRSLREVGLR